MKKILSLLLCLVMLLSMSALARAENIQSRAVIGADLTPEQVAVVYNTFCLPQGSVIQLTLTNAEERQYLEGFVDPAVIGTRSISCVFVELLPAGSGMNISTSNVTWCTSQMYVSALATAGITDAHIIVTAPFAVSGTAALAGIYKAYEDMTGSSLDGNAKLVGTQELTVTGELAQEIGSNDSASIVSELKLILNETKSMSDEQIRAQITAIASKYHVTLTETQIRQLISLCRSLESLDPDALKSRVEGVQNTFSKVSEVKDQVAGFVSSVTNAINTLQDLIARIQALLDKFGF